MARKRHEISWSNSAPILLYLLREDATSVGSTTVSSNGSQTMHMQNAREFGSGRTAERGKAEMSWHFGIENSAWAGRAEYPVPNVHWAELTGYRFDEY
jgi:hypothetical protein